MIRYFVALFLFAFLTSATIDPKDFELRVIDPGNDDIFFVRNYSRYPILVSHLDYEDIDGPVLGPQLFHFDDDEKLRSSKNDYFVSVQTWDSWGENKQTLLFNDTVSFDGFHKQDGYLAHNGNTTFFSCNAYPTDKYVEFLTIDDSCFLAHPVQLRLVYPV